MKKNNYTVSIDKLISYILKELFALVRKRSRVQASSTAQSDKGHLLVAFVVLHLEVWLNS